MICLIVNTADYCSQQTIGIAEEVKKQINTRLIDQVDLKPEQSEFDK